MIFTSEDGIPASGRLRTTQDTWQSIPVHRVIHGEPPGFELSYTDPEMDGIFRDLISELRPDVVHFQHAFRLSAGMVSECKKAGVPAVITLADYWFICPPIIMLQPGMALCPGPETDRCARCPNAIGVFVLPPSIEELQRRLRARGTESQASLKRRFSAALEEIKNYQLFNYIVVNGELGVAYDELRSILVAERVRTDRMAYLAKDMLGV